MLVALMTQNYYTSSSKLTEQIGKRLSRVTTWTGGNGLRLMIKGR